MFPADRIALAQPVSVEYTAHGQRAIKVLPNAYAARRFFAVKLKQGAHPSLAMRSCTMATKKATKKKPAPETGTHRNADVPWNEKKVAVFKALKALGATSPAKARSSTEVAAKAKTITARDVRHYAYHARAAGLTDVAKVQGLIGHGFYLTPKGAKVDPAAELKRATAAKAAK